MEHTKSTVHDSEVPTPHAQAVAALHRALALAQPAAMQQALTLQTLFGGWASRTAGTGISTLHLTHFSIDAQSMTEWLQLQAAIVQRLQEQQQEWMLGWAGWLHERARVKRANTMSKLLEQEFDLLARFVLLLSGQAVDLVTLQENVEVNTGYWIGQKLASKSGAA